MSSAPDDKPQDERSPILRDFALFGLIVTDLVVYTGLGVYLGWWAWKKLGLWWLGLLFLWQGLGLAIYRIYKRSQRG